MSLDEIKIREEGRMAFYPEGDPKDHNPYGHNQAGHTDFESRLWMIGWSSQALRHQQTTEEATNKLHVETVGGNLFYLETYINKKGWADYVIAVHLSDSGTFAQVVLKMPREMVHKIRSERPSYCSPVDHDDCESEEEDFLCLKS